MNVQELGQGLSNMAQRLWPTADGWSPPTLARSASPIQELVPEDDAIVVTAPPPSPRRSDSSPELPLVTPKAKRPALPPRRMSAPAVPIITPPRITDGDAENRLMLATCMSADYINLVCTVDAICLMSVRLGLGLPSERPRRLSGIIRRQLEKMGVVEEIDLIRAESLSLPTLRGRMLVQGTAITAAETEFAVTFAYGVTRDDVKPAATNEYNQKLIMAMQLADMLPIDGKELGEKSIEQGIEFVSQQMSHETLELLLHYQTSAEGRPYMAENKHAEARIGALFSQPRIQAAINTAFYEAFTDWGGAFCERTGRLRIGPQASAQS